MTVLDFASMTWKCNVCGDERPDAIISVAKRQGPIPAAVWNIRYCNDRPACVEYAHQTGEWTGPAEHYKIPVSCAAPNIKELARLGAATIAVPYDVTWTSVRHVTRAIVTLAATSEEAARRHAVDALRAADVDVADR